MKVFTNDTDTVIADDLADVERVLDEHYGAGCLVNEGWSLDDWREVPDDQHITIHNFDDQNNVASKTARCWIDRDGRGFLCSTEY